MSKNDSKFCHLWSSYIEYMLSGQNGVKSRKREEGEEYYIGRGHRQIPSHTQIFILIEFFTFCRKEEEEGSFLIFRWMNSSTIESSIDIWFRHGKSRLSLDLKMHSIMWDRLSILKILAIEVVHSDA